MKIGDLVTYGKWYRHNVYGSMRIGVILEGDPGNRKGDPKRSSWFVMWSGFDPEWECEDDLELLDENR